MSVVDEYLPMLLLAAWMTLWLTVLSVLLGGLIGLSLAIVRGSRSPASRIVAIYSWVLQTSPVLLILFFAYYGLPSVGITMPAFETAVVALGLSSSAYQLEIFRSGFASVPLGQLEAANALGIPAMRVWWRIVLPQALPVIIPPYVSHVTLQLKGTSLASIVTVDELTGVATGLIALTFKPFEFLLAISVIYLVMNSVLTGLQAAAERKYASH